MAQTQSSKENFVDPGTQIAGTATEYVKEGVATSIDHLLLYNTNTTTEDVVIYRVVAGGSVTDADIVAKKTVLADEVAVISFAHNLVLRSADALALKTDTASKVNLQISGRRYL